VLSIYGNSFETVGKASQVKLVERMPRMCKLSSWQWVATLKNLKYFFGYEMIPYVLFHSFDVFNIILQQIKYKT
jgi:hypothetical protein